MKRTKQEAEQTKNELLDVAFKEFLETGYNESRLEDIAAKAGVTRGALYWHFKNKDDLLDSLISQKDIESNKIADEIAGSDDEPFEKLKKFVNLNFPDLSGGRKEKNYVKLKVELYKHFNEKGDKNKSAEKFTAHCKKFIEQCKSRGEIKDEIDPADAANTIMIICAGSYIRFNSIQSNKRAIKYSKKLALDYLYLIHK